MSTRDLTENMCLLCRDIGKDLSKFNVNVIAVEDIINNCLNKSYDCVDNFYEMELIEEKMDEMLYYYQFIKAKFKRGRLIREKIEEKEKEK